MGTSFEYKFVRLGKYAGPAFFGVHDKVRNTYEEVVHELIFERERAENATTPWKPVGSGSTAQNGHEAKSRS